MYKKLNIREVIFGHLGTFNSTKGKLLRSDVRDFLVIPLVLSFFLASVRQPNSNIQEILSICISILTGLLLNLLVLILSNISTRDIKISSVNAASRMKLIKETYFNISFSILLCLITLGSVFIHYVLDKSEQAHSIFLRFFKDPNTIYWVFGFLYGFLLYFFLIQIFLHLFLVLKRITKIFTIDMKLHLETRSPEDPNEQ